MHWVKKSENGRVAAYACCSRGESPSPFPQPGESQAPFPSVGQLADCSMVAIEPNEYAAEDHDRMPVILVEVKDLEQQEHGDYRRWCFVAVAGG
jgi:putative SOS response-associated peptidase YedK